MSALFVVTEPPEYGDHLPPDPAADIDRVTLLDEHGNVFTAGPDFLVPGRIPDGVKPTATGPVFLSADWDTVEEQIAPVFMPVAGGQPLLYQGESHMVYGTGGSGKSWFAAKAIVDVVRTGHVVLVLDYESNLRTWKERLKALGVTREEAGRIAYWRVSSSLMWTAPAGRALIEWVDEYHPDLVILDSVAKALGAAGLNENDNSEFIKWESGVINPLTQKRVTSLLIDHTGHSAEQAAARGASAKKDQMSGAVYKFETVEHWTRENSGSAQGVVMKDREGWRKVGCTAFEMVVTVADGGARVGIELVAPSVSSSGYKYSWYMGFISDLLADRGPLTGYALEQEAVAAGKSKSYISSALADMVSGGFVSVATGARNARLYTLVKPFVEAGGAVSVPDRVPLRENPFS